MWVVGGLVTLIGGWVEHRCSVGAGSTGGATTTTRAAADAAKEGEAEYENGDDDANYGRPSDGKVSGEGQYKEGM